MEELKDHIVDENGYSYTKTTIHQVVDGKEEDTEVYLPDIELPPEPEPKFGIWSQRRRRFLKEYRPGIYYDLLTSCKLTAHLNEVQERASRMKEELEEAMAKQEGITEQLKATDMMSWVRKMNNISARVREIIYAEIIYA